MFTPEDLEELAELVAVGWEGAASADWSARAGPLEWSCAKTADHVIDTVVAPAFFLSSRRVDDYPEGGWSPGDDADPDRFARGLRTAARLLAATVRGSDPDAHAIIWRLPTTETRPPVDFVPRGGLELILHASDVAAGLNVEFTPPVAICERLRSHTQDWPFWTFAPGWSPLTMTGDPWADLLRASGRGR